MKFVLVIHQEKLLMLAPEATLDDGAVIDVLQSLFASASAPVEASRITGPDGQRYTWIDYTFLLSEIPLLHGKKKQTMSRIIKRLEQWGVIVTISPDHQRKFAAPGKNMEQLIRVDKYPKPFQKRNRAVPKAEQLQGESCSANGTYQDTSIQETIDPRRRGDKSPSNRDGPTPISAIIPGRLQP